MQHWVDTLDAATSIVLQHKSRMDNQKLLAYCGVIMIVAILITAISELYRTFKTHDDGATIPIPNGARVVIIPPQAVNNA
jgi:hypothetical protein